MQSICVFCGSSPGADPAYVETARALGRALAHQGITLVFGGSSVGLMKAVADAVLAEGGKVIGVIPQHLVELEVAHHGLTELKIVGDMHERKATMARLSDGFIALPGGIGTLEELFEVWTWAQLGMHGKPVGLLNMADYYTPLLGFLDHMVDQRFLRAEHRGLVQVARDPAELLGLMASYQAPVLRKWVDEGAV